MKTKYSNCITFSNKGRYNDGKCSFEYNIEHEVYSKIKVIAKSLPHPRRKSYVSPYAKFDRIKKKRK